MNKIEKLELKHLCGYLPHGLEVFNENSSSKGVILKNLSLDTPQWVLDGIKPLLVPLSALTEPLPDGSVPIIEAAKIAYKWQEWDKKRINKNNGVLEGCRYDFWFSEEKKEFMLCDGDRYFHVNNQLQLFEYLYSIHADIYGLIPAGLAIDKRTIKL